MQTQTIQTQIGQICILLGRLLQDPATQAQIANGVPIADLLGRQLGQQPVVNDNIIMRQNHAIQDLRDPPTVNDNFITRQ